MAGSWKDVVGELAGPRARMRVRPSPSDWAGNLVAELELGKPLPLLPGTTFQASGVDAEAAWSRIAHDLAAHRLIETLEAAGWDCVEEVVDQTTYVAARDPNTKWWAIGVAVADGDRRGYIETDIGFDDRVFDRIAFVEPLDTRDSESLFAALKASA